MQKFEPNSEFIVIPLISIQHWSTQRAFASVKKYYYILIIVVTFETVTPAANANNESYTYEIKNQNNDVVINISRIDQFTRMGFWVGCLWQIDAKRSNQFLVCSALSKEEMKEKKSE